MKKNDTLQELLVGIILLGIAFQMVCICVSKDYLYNAVGLWSGIAIACFMAIHMKRSIEDALDLGEEGAEKYARKAYVIRVLVAALIIGVVIYFNLGNPITLVIGIFPLKPSAYLQPQIHKVFSWLRKRRKED